MDTKETKHVQERGSFGKFLRLCTLSVVLPPPRHQGRRLQRELRSLLQIAKQILCITEIHEQAAAGWGTGAPHIYIWCGDVNASAPMFTAVSEGGERRNGSTRGVLD